MKEGLEGKLMKNPRKKGNRKIRRGERENTSRNKYCLKRGEGRTENREGFKRMREMEKMKIDRSQKDRRDRNYL